MQKILCTEFGDPELLQLVDEPVPEVGPGQALLATEAAGVSFVDGLVVRGGYQVKPPLPFTPGNSVVGTLQAVGEGVDETLVGQRVACVLKKPGGAYSSHVLVNPETVAIVPENISAQRAAASMESYLTLWFAITHRVSINAGEYVVVLGASGGIGLAAIDIARSLGAEVIAVASTEQKRALALRSGARIAIGYENLKDEIRSATQGGADVVIDPVGGEASESALRALATGGRFCVVGFASGQIPRLPANVVLLRNRSIVGVDWGDWSREEAGVDGNARLLTQLFERISSGELNPPEPSVVPLADAGQVLTMIAERRALGKYVLKP